MISTIRRLFGLCALVGSSALGAQTDLNERTLEELSKTGLSEPPRDVSVTTASKYAQASNLAPAAVRIVTAEDISTYGYRSLAEVLRSLPGVYVTSDRNYTYVGVRGFGRPGDSNSRVLLMIDGQRINDAVYDAASIGNEFLLDVDLIDRVEFVPGPGSALYGNNAFFGVINVITKRGPDFNGAQLSAAYGGFDTYKARGSYGQRFDNGAEMLLSATGFDQEGADHLYFREYDTPEQNHGFAEHLDYDRYHSAFGKFSWKGFTLEGGYSDRTKGIPTASFGQTFNAPGSQTEDRQIFAHLSYDDQIAQDWGFYLRLNYNLYDYSGDYIYSDPSPRTINRDIGIGESWGGEFRLTNTSFTDHKLIFGAQLQDNLQQFQKNFNVGGALNLDIPYQSTRYGIYLQDEYRLMDSLTLIAGARYDYNPLGGGSANPRLGLIWQPLDSTTLKLVYGTAFRAPTVFERFYADNISSKGNPGLKPETIKTLELILDHYFTPSTHLSASYYHYEINDLISQATDPKDGLLYYSNLGTAKANGIELQGEQRFRNGVRARLSYVWQQALDGHGQELTNSPQHQVKLHLSAPLWDERWRAGFETLYFSERRSLTGKVGGYVLSNLTINWDILKNLQFSASVYNLLDYRYADPVGAEFVQDGIVQDGRSFRIKLNLRF